MDANRMSESAWRRAGQDMIRGTRTIRFWVSQMVALAIAAPLATYLAPNEWSEMGTAWFVAGVVIAAGLLVGGFTYIATLLIAPYRQRDEARAQLGAIPGTPRRGTASLQIEDPYWEFGTSGERGFEGLGIDDGLAVIGVSALYIVAAR